MTTQELFQGYPPQLAVGAGNPEAQKYGRLWETEAYRALSPGEHLVQRFLQLAQPRRGAHVLDLGCGTGRGAFMLSMLGGLRVTMVDFVRNSLDPEIREALTTNGDMLAFVKADLEQPLPVTAEYGFCCDVLEHIPTDRVHLVLNNVLRAAKHVFFSIALYEDACGDLIGERLHLTIQPYAWWLEALTKAGCTIHYAECVPVDGQPHHANIYCTLWEDGQVLVDRGEPNTAEAAIRANMAHNCAQGWQQVTPHETQETEVMILGGGPSLSGFESDIKAKRAAGVKLITLNNTYTWCLDHGLTPSATIIVDAREFNKRFTTPVVDGCKYLMASQVHPAVLEGLPKDRTYLWHVLGEPTKDIVPQHYPVAYPIPGGSTVLLRAIPLLRMLGFHRFHLYGCDSCLSEDTHHAYSQPENDSETVVPIMVEGGRVFRCHPWMASQAQEFVTLIRNLGETFDLAIYGDGLLAHIIHTGAALCTAPETEN